ncbi:MAG: DUF4136 domain-containing protein [Verrucomicrobia bacterium]|nr:DUF4136 domain-containing protein [Verrucomicrobiota bacterium]
MPIFIGANRESFRPGQAASRAAWQQASFSRVLRTGEKLGLAGLAVAGLLFAGCASTQTNTTTPAGATSVDKIAKRKTFSFVPDKAMEAAAAVSNAAYWHQKLQDDVAAELTSKGYQQVASGGQFYVALHAVIKRGESVTVLDNYSGYSLPKGQSSVYSFAASAQKAGSNTGTLIVDIVDPATKEIVWRGWKRTTLLLARTPGAREELLRNVVRDILSSFPSHS